MYRVALFVGRIQALPQSGRPSAIFKQPLTVAGRVDEHGFVDDAQADCRVHGGPDKAIHLYPSAHYARLAAAFPDAAAQLRPGSLGENLAVAGIDENDVHFGDIWQLGEVSLQLSQPRNPCWKIDERFACAGIAAYIAEQRLTGWYWRVLAGGTVRPGDPLICRERPAGTLSLARAQALWQAHRPDFAALDELAAQPGLAADWRRKIVQRADWLRADAGKFHVEPAA